jgi:hypothetical protein
MDQLELDMVGLAPVEEEPEPRTYWEHRGPQEWQQVLVRVRYAPAAGLGESPFPHVRTGRVAPRNVLVERSDGSRAVRPVRLLRVRCPR